MSVLVKGMKMPEHCYVCKVWFECFEEEPPFNMIKSVCPLVEVKEPHGRLIDADEIEMPCLETTADQKRMEIAIKSTPTVIEAEGSEE